MTTTIMIRDLLDFSSLPGASISPGSVPPRSGGTVHHRPPHLAAEKTPEGVKAAVRIPSKLPPRALTQQRKSSIGQRRERDGGMKERCPNVVVINGVICTQHRSRGHRDSSTMEVRGRDVGNKKEKKEEKNNEQQGN